ncbi:MAG: PIN domain-containing protein [Clostridia bacterium]|nr:PIN domain-containing protein [Clostridia bacterium]
MIKRLYIDTSVFGGYFDIEFDTDTKPFFKRVFKSSIRLLISDILEFEIYNAPAFVQDFYESIPAELVERVGLNEEASILAEKYIAEKVVGKTSLADCQHIALATINKADVLVSWNYKHIVNLERIKGYNAINYRQGYQMIEIRTPKEIFIYENTAE